MKGFTGLKKCRDGEVYRFKKGKALVPGMRMGSFPSWGWRSAHCPVYITFKEFIQLNKEEEICNW